jgi:multidrug efflux pump subunit AcrA (membrane-fusion protein)
MARLAIIILVGLVVTSCGKPEAAPAGAPPEMVFPVTVVKVTRGPVTETANLTGTVRWPTRVAISTEVSGRVVTAPPSNGTRMKKGETLIQIDATDLELTVKRRTAELAQARARLDLLETETRTEILDRVGDELKETEAKMDLAQEEHDRVTGLVAKEIRPKSELTRVKANLAAAKAAVGQRQAALKEVQNGATQAEREVVRAEVAVAEAVLADAQAQRRKTKVVAPFDGIVQWKEVELGTVVAPGTELLELAADSKVQINVEVPERYVGAVTPGRELPFTADAFPGKTFTAKVVSVLPDGDQRSRTFTVQARVAEPEGLLPRMFVRVPFPVAVVSDTLLAPKDAVTYKGDNAVLFVVNDGAVRMVPVTVGISSGSLVQITGDVVEGAVVVSTGGEVLFPGAKVMDVAAARGRPQGPPAK